MNRLTRTMRLVLTALPRMKRRVKPKRWGMRRPVVSISGATLAKAKGKYRTRRLGEVTVKGKQIQTEIFALLG